MKLLIAAIGKAKATAPEQALLNDYLKRIKWKVACKEFVSKQQDAGKRQAEEAELLLGAAQDYDRIVALDEKGKTLSSQEFAAQLQRWQGQGFSSAAFIIGGAGGLAKPVLDKADLMWSLGRVTWPHMLVRALLAEQLYRAQSLIAGHPYHRE